MHICIRIHSYYIYIHVCIYIYIVGVDLCIHIYIYTHIESHLHVFDMSALYPKPRSNTSLNHASRNPKPTPNKS